MSPISAMTPFEAALMFICLVGLAAAILPGGW